MLINVKTVSAILGASNRPVSHTEKVVSACGGFIAILAIFVVSQWSVGPAAVIIVASMGASAVLLFAVPHGPLSQPWPLFGGHIISAIVGVSCASIISNDVLAASLAVGVAIAAMYYLRCIHPPGGATALSAVIGGESVQALGYQFVIMPILLNVMIMLFVGVVYNAFFHWRRYPGFRYQQKNTVDPSGSLAENNITHEDFAHALSEIDSYIDISEHDLKRIYDLVTNQSLSHTLPAKNLSIGDYYSNGKYGKDWSVRLVVEVSDEGDRSDEPVRFKIVAGDGRRTSGTTSRQEFLQWARYQVIRDEDNWKRIDESN